MQLTGEHIAAFQDLYKKRFGMEISEEQAREQGTQLLRLMHLTYKPITKDQLKRVQDRHAKLTKIKIT